MIDGRIYVTTGDDNIFAVDAVTGKVIWRWKPDNVAVFRNFGIVANRGVAYCAGKLFITTLDMHIVSVRPADGQADQAGADRRGGARRGFRTTATRRRARRSAPTGTSCSAPPARSTACAAS